MSEEFRKEDGEFEDMEEELEWFDEPPSFNDLCVRLNAKFGGDFTIKGRFDSGKTRPKYVLMPLRDPAHWSCYTRVLAGSNSPIIEVVVGMGTGWRMIIMTMLEVTKKQFNSHPVSCIWMVS
jgi:hypothetical protein